MKVAVVLAVISMNISNSSGAAISACSSDASDITTPDIVTPDIVTPTSTIPETRTNWNSAQIQAVYSDMNAIDGSLSNFDQIFNSTDKNAKIKKWSRNLSLGSVEYDGGQWMNYYLLIDALKHKTQLAFAVKILDELHVPGTLITTVSAKIRELMRGGSNSEYEGILTSLYGAEDLRTTGNGDLIDDLRSRLTILAYEKNYNDYLNCKASDLILPTVLTNERNPVKFYVGLMKSTKEEIKTIIGSIVAYDNIELANVSLTKVTTGSDCVAVTKELAKNGIWGHVKSETMARLLWNKFKVPIYKVRSDVYGIADELDRYKVLKMLKNTLESDVTSHTALFANDKKMTMREALMTGKSNFVKAFFSRAEYNREMYDPKWILHAIKFSTQACLTILLEERVPLPAVTELTAAYALQKEQGSKLLVESYGAKYAALDIALSLPPAVSTTLHDPEITAAETLNAAETDPGDLFDLYPAITQIGEHERDLFINLRAIIPAVNGSRS